MDTLDRIRKEINDRLAELRPIAREYERLEQAHAALEASGPAEDTAGRAARGAGAPGARARRSATGVSVREQILAAARDNPEAKRGDIARLTGLSPTTVGTSLSKLRAEGLLPRSPRSRFAAPSDAATESASDAATISASDAATESAPATDTPIAEPPAGAAPAGNGDGPERELQPAHAPEDAEQPAATPGPGEGETAPSEPPKRRAMKRRPRSAKAPSG